MFRVNVKQLMALALLSLSEPVAGFHLLVMEFDDDDNDLLNSLEKT